MAHCYHEPYAGSSLSLAFNSAAVDGPDHLDLGAGSMDGELYQISALHEVEKLARGRQEMQRNTLYAAGVQLARL